MACSGDTISLETFENLAPRLLPLLDLNDISLSTSCEYLRLSRRPRETHSKYSIESESRNDGIDSRRIVKLSLTAMDKPVS